MDNEHTPPSIVAELIAVGDQWIRYGLTVGEQSLRATARTLEGTARLLGEIAGRLAPEPPKAPGAAA
jgi:hypothetical protein